MSPELLLERFGYFAVYLGTFLEGETILVLAGFFSQRGYLSFPIVVIVAFLGSISGHIFWFWLGRTQGLKIFKRYPKMEKHFGKGIRMFERYGAPTIFVSQYLYGLRISCAIIVGLSKISIPKFLFYEAISCSTWAFVIAVLGYYFGEAVDRMLGKAAHVEKYALLVLLLIGLCVWLYHKRKEKKEELIAE